MPDEFDNYPPETLIELGKLTLRMSRDKETRRPLLKGIKKINPDYQLPGDQQVEDLRQELAEKADADKLAREQDAIRTRLEGQRKGLADGTLLPGRKFDDDAIKEIEEKIMPRYGISDYEAAAKIYASDLKPTKPQQNAPGAPTGTWTFPDIPGLMEDPAKAAREAAHNLITEMRGTA